MEKIETFAVGINMGLSGLFGHLFRKKQDPWLLYPTLYTHMADFPQPELLTRSVFSRETETMYRFGTLDTFEEWNPFLKKKP